MKVLWIFSAVLLVGASVRPAEAATYYVDIKNAQCSDAAGSGTQTRPYCSVRYATTIAKPGDTFLIQSGMYNPGPLNFTRDGTATAPITYRAVGYVTFATQLADENLRPTTVANVYSMPYTLPASFAQTRFPPILVDDPNQSKFTMIQEDGPLRLTLAPDDATLAAHEGMYILSGGVLRVHPYGNVVPSAAGTDLISTAGNVAFNVSADYNVFDGFTILFSASFSGSNNKYLNMTFRTQAFVLGGHDNYAENLTISHVIQRTASGKWLWYESGQGTGGGMATGSARNRLKNIHIFHNWNSSFSSEGATGAVVDGARMHGAPNHCSLLANGNSTIRNAVWYNSQDFQWLTDTNGLTLEHVVLPGGGIGISAATRTLGPVIIRNSIFSGTFHFVRGSAATAALPYQGCTWEKGSLMENNIISSSATIERCANQTKYPILTYMAKCASGEFTDCMTIRNNRIVPAGTFETIIKDGMWKESLGDNWDVHLVANSPAINAGMPSGTIRDIDDVARPQGSAPDIGVYELCTSGNCPSPPPPPPPTSSACDINRDTITNIMDVQLCVNQSLGLASCTADINHDGRCDILDVQRVGNAALYGTCLSS